MTYPTKPESSIHPYASAEPPDGSGEPVEYQKSINEKISVRDIRNTLSVRLPMRLLPYSLRSAVAVHEKATPIDMSSPKYVIFIYLTAKVSVFCDMRNMEPLYSL